MHALSRPDLTLSPTVVYKVMTYWYDLSFEEVAQLESQIVHSLNVVERLRQVCRHLEGE